MRLAERIAAAAAGFNGVVSLRRGDSVEFEAAYGLAERAHAVRPTPETRYAIASGTKGFTALAVVSLVVDAQLSLETTARSLLGADLPLIADDVTVRHLLGHTSGIGDYCDEDAEEEPELAVPAQSLASTADYLAALDGFPTKFAAGERFSYCNGGYAVLALLAERASELDFAELLRTRVFTPAGMAATGFLRSDALPGDAAVGYLEDGRTNVFALPVMGTGDGGAYTNACDMHALWTALGAGRIVPPEWVAAMTTLTSAVPAEQMDYGLGFWLTRGDARGRVALVGSDFGVSFSSEHDPATGTTATVLSNTGDGAWQLRRLLLELAFSPLPDRAAPPASRSLQMHRGRSGARAFAAGLTKGDVCRSQDG